MSSKPKSAIPNSAISGISTTSSTEGKKRAKTREKDWHEEANPTSKNELNSWYLYDWANSVFSSAAVVMWLPYLLLGLAEMKACPYSYVEPVVTEDHRWFRPEVISVFGNSIEDTWVGYFNETTTCRYDWDQALSLGLWSVDVDIKPPYYLERGNPNYGLQYLPLHIRSKEPFCAAEDECQDFPDEPYDTRKTAPEARRKHLPFDSAYDAVITCDYPTAIKFEPVRNVSYYAVADGAKSNGEFKGDGSTKIVDGSDRSDYIGPINFDLALTSDSATVDITKVSFVSSNPFNILAENIQFTPKSGGGYNMVVVPEQFAVGASTISILVDDVKVMSFTVNTLKMPFCPFPVQFLGMESLPVTYVLDLIFLSVLFQAFFFITFSGLGDFGPYRKMILMQTGIGGSLCCMSNILFTEGDQYELAGLVFIISNVLFGASIVMYNAYLPFITKCHPTFMDKMTDFKAQKAGGAMKIGKALKELLEVYADLMDAISANGCLYGYISGALMVIITMIIIMLEPTWFGIRLSIFLTGLWWFIFSLPMIPYLEKRPGPPLPNANCAFYLTFSFKRLLASMRCLPHIPETMRFLIAYFLYSDAYSTIASVGLLFAVEEMNMGAMEVALLAFIAPICAAVGIVFFRWVQIRNHYDTKKMILICLGIIAGMVGYGILGFSGVIGVVYKWELYALIFVYGFVLGPIQSYTRVAYTDVVPPGQESEFFGIYEISDKGSSWMGPLICARLYQATGSMRPAFVYLLFMSLVGFYLVHKTDFEEGSDACRRKEIQVRMEAVRKKLGVSKIQIQMNAKKFLGVKSSTASSTTASGVSTKSSAVESTVETGSAKDERSVIDKGMKELTHDDVVDAPIDALLQKGSTLEVGETAAEHMPKRKGSILSVRSRATGATGPRSTKEKPEGERSARSSSRGRKSSLHQIAEVANLGDLSVANVGGNKVAPVGEP
ncbi:hypothetical protein TrLO_g3900 [Triparma laevis f. longispina]|uniref:Uncharacterized protein n=1 Tax=Triparma laevis f. longispina TaxID=1714387 RepID=A0A9W7ALU9_9STRA|nr:hypothetical protein TrLO_g3900 [Triparma laevis f. longispina]